MGIQGRVAVVTGGAGGIGAGIAKSFVEQGARVAVVDVDRMLADEFLSSVGAPGDRLTYVSADVSDESDVQRAFEQVRESFGPVEILINNAGVIDDATAFAQMTAHSWDRMLSVNTRSQFLCSREATRHMEPARRGRIVNIASRSWLGNTGIAGYCASKGAVVSLTRSLAIELGPLGITANAISPTLIVTPLFENMPLAEQEADLARASRQPIPRLGLPSDVALVASFFVSDEADFITGQHVYVGGGAELRGSMP